MTFPVYHLIDGELVSSWETIDYVGVYAYAPNTFNRVEAFRTTEEFSDESIEGLNLNGDEQFPLAERIGYASAQYNCHAYAWCDGNTYSNYWINDPTGFFQNNSCYTEVVTPVNGDIICYYYGTKIIHSGIVYEVNDQLSNNLCGNSNTVEVISKWGHSGAYLHNGYQCPYTTYVEHSVDSPAATTVKYFRYHSHSFSYSRNLGNPSVHTAHCNTCDYSYEEGHTYSDLPDGTYRCIKCKYVAVGQIIMSDQTDTFEE